MINAPCAESFPARGIAMRDLRRLWANRVHTPSAGEVDAISSLGLSRSHCKN
jgi:hypothetical protein